MKQKLYTLRYTLKFHNDDSNTDSLVTYSVFGIVGLTVKANSIHVDYDDSSSMASMGWDLLGELVKVEIVEEE